MNSPVTSQRRPYLTLIVLCAVSIFMTSCFMFRGDDSTVASDLADVEENSELEIGDITTFEVASTLREAGRYEEALLVYLEAIQANPTSIVAANAMNEMAGIYILTEEYEKSLQTYGDLLTNFPTYQRAEEVQKKIDFVEKALSVQQERLKVSNEGTNVN